MANKRSKKYAKKSFLALEKQRHYKLSSDIKPKELVEIKRTALFQYFELRVEMNIDAGK